MTAAEIAAALAAFKPTKPYPVGSSSGLRRICVFCDEVGPYYDPPTFAHAPDCLWLAASRVTG